MKQSWQFLMAHEVIKDVSGGEGSLRSCISGDWSYSCRVAPNNATVDPGQTDQSDWVNIALLNLDQDC